MKTVALELSKRDKNWLPFGLIAGMTGYVPGPGVLIDNPSTKGLVWNSNKHEDTKIGSFGTEGVLAGFFAWGFPNFICAWTGD